MTGERGKFGGVKPDRFRREEYQIARIVRALLGAVDEDRIEHPGQTVLRGAAEDSDENDNAAEIEDTSALEDFELGDSIADNNASIVNNDNVTNFQDGDNGPIENDNDNVLEEFELGDSKVDNNASLVSYDNDDINNDNNFQQDGEDNNALEDFELGDSNIENNNNSSIINSNETNNYNSKVTIYNRFGQLITKFDAFNQGWDGKWNNELLFADDYWYVIELEDGRIAKGHFSLKR